MHTADPELQVIDADCVPHASPRPTTVQVTEAEFSVHVSALAIVAGAVTDTLNRVRCPLLDAGFTAGDARRGVRYQDGLALDVLLLADDDLFRKAGSIQDRHLNHHLG